MALIKAPFDFANAHPLVFLSGSIEMHTETDWQTRLAMNFEGQEFTFLHPRRNDWGKAWTSSIGQPEFVEQVEWEMKGMEQAVLIVQYFNPKSQSPISLLELGLFAKSGKMIVCCPEGFWKKGYVDMVCRRYGVSQALDFDDLVKKTRQSLAAMPRPSAGN